MDHRNVLLAWEIRRLLHPLHSSFDNMLLKCRPRDNLHSVVALVNHRRGTFSYLLSFRLNMQRVCIVTEFLGRAEALIDHTALGLWIHRRVVLGRRTLGGYDLHFIACIVFHWLINQFLNSHNDNSDIEIEGRNGFPFCKRLPCDSLISIISNNSHTHTL